MGYLEIQTNSLYRKGEDNQKDKHYMELDSHCPTGNCPSTNVSLQQKIAIEESADSFSNFEARKRRAMENDSVIDIYFYKKGTKASDRQKLTGIKRMTIDTYVELPETETVPAST